MAKRKGQVRTGWRKLSKPYRTRLERSGVTQRAWEDGIDLRAARGKKPKPPPGAPPKELYDRIISGEATEADFRTLATSFRRPSWVPKDASVDVAAALSNLTTPKNWDTVDFIPRPDGEPWTMIVTRKRGNPISIEIPGGGGPGSGAKEILEIVRELGQQVGSRGPVTADDVFGEVMGSQ